MNQATYQLYGRLQHLFGRLQHCQATMSPLAKLGWVFAGYVLAVIIAAAAVACEVAAYYALGVHDDSGMKAFGDSLLFLAVFAVASVPPTILALRSLAPYTAFWRASSAAALVLALAALVASFEVIAGARSLVDGVAFLLVLAAPLCALAFGLSGFFAPIRTSRISFFVATTIEATAFAAWLISCIFRSP